MIPVLAQAWTYVFTVNQLQHILHFLQEKCLSNPTFHLTAAFFTGGFCLWFFGNTNIFMGILLLDFESQTMLLQSKKDGASLNLKIL